MSWQIIQGPAAEPVTVAEVKARLRITNFTGDDSVIAQNITAARLAAEKWMHRSLVSKSYAVFFDRFPWPNEPIRVPMPPLLSVTAIKYTDPTGVLQTWPANEYMVSTVNVPGLVFPNPTIAGNTYPATLLAPGMVEVDITSGPDPNPSNPGQILELLDAYEGVRQLAVHIYEHPEAVTSDVIKEIPLALRAFFLTSKVWVF